MAAGRSGGSPTRPPGALGPPALRPPTKVLLALALCLCMAHPASAGTICTNADIYGDSGNIQSPHYSANYNNNHNCNLYIHFDNPTGETVAVEITVLDFVMEGCCDYFTVYSNAGPKSYNGGTPIYAGNTYTYYTSANNMRFTFTTDGSVTFKGFNLNYLVVSTSGSLCSNTVLRGAAGTITSPNFPSVYDPGHSCSLRLEFDNPGGVKSVRFLVNAFHTEPCCDPVTIETNTYRGNAAVDMEALSIGQYYWFSTSETYVTLTFASDGSVQYSGFSLAYDIIEYHAIYGVTANANAVALGDTTALTIAADAGSDMTVVADFDDGFLVQNWYADPTQLEVLYHNYTDVGIYNISVWLSNNRSYVEVQAVAEVDEVLTNFNISGNHTSLGDPTTIVISLDGGSHPRVVLQYDVNDAAEGEENTTFVSAADIPVFSHTYATVGAKLIRASVSNSISSATLEITAYVVRAIETPSTSATSPSNETEVVLFTSALGGGSHVTCTYDFGDGLYETVYAESPNGTMTASHEYPVGVYVASVNCYNHIGDFNSEVPVVVQRPIADFSFLPTVINQVASTGLTLDWSISNGTNVTFKVLVNDVEEGSVVETSTGAWSATLAPSAFIVGRHVLKVEGDNMVSHVATEVPLNVDTVLSGLTLHGQPYVRVGTPWVVYSTLQEGSNPEFSVDWGDGSPPSVGPEQPGLGLREDNHTYANPVSCTVNISVSNSVSNVTASIDVDVQHPLGEYELTCSNVTRQEQEVTCVLTQTAGESATAVTGNLTFGDSGGGSLLEPLVLTTGDSHNLTHTYSAYGRYDVQLSMWNGVSATVVTPQHSVQVGVEISGASISVTSYDVMAGEPVTFAVHVDAGSDLEYAVDVGDGNSPPATGRTSSDWTAPDDIAITHTYVTSAYYTVRLTASNALGSEEVSLPQTLTALSAVTGLSGSMDQDAIQITDTLTLVVGVTDGSLVTAFVRFSDESVWEIQNMTNFSAASSPVTFTHQYSQPGNFTIRILGNNSLSYQEVSYDVTVQRPLAEVSLRATSPVSYPDGLVTFDLSLSDPSLPPTGPIWCVWSFKDGTSATVYTPELSQGQTVHLDRQFGDTAVGNGISRVNCSNLVSSAASDVDHEIQIIIESPVLRVLNASGPPESPILFEVELGRASHAKYEVWFTGSDGPMETVTHQNPLDSTGVLQLSHVYSVPGNYSVSIRISNNVSEVRLDASQDQVVQIQRPITVLTLTLLPEVVPFPPGDINFTISVPADVTAPDKVVIAWDFGDGAGIGNPESAEDLSIPNPISLVHTFPAPGSYPVALRCNNVISATTLLANVSVVALVTGLQLTTGAQVVSPGAPVRFEVTLTNGTEFTLAVHFEDGTNPDTMTIAVADGGPFVFEHTFASAGDYRVRVNATNAVSSLEARLAAVTGSIADYVTVQHPVVGFTVASNSPVSLPTGVPTIYIFRDQQLPLPTALVVEIDFGDGIVTPFRDLDLSWIQQVNHTYAAVGHYVVNVTIRNGYGSQREWLSMDVEEGITGLGFSAWEEGSPAPPPGPPIQTAPDVFPMDALVNFRAEISAGSNVVYNWTFSETVHYGSTTPEVLRRFTTPGRHKVTLAASNAVNAGEISTRDVTITSSVDIKAIGYDRNVIIGDVVQFTIEMKEVKTDLCLKLDLTLGGSHVVQHQAAQIGLCPDAAPETFTAVAPTTTYHMAFTPKAEGRWAVNVTAIQTHSEPEIHDILQVDGVPCFPPQVDVADGPGKSPDDPRVFRKSRAIETFLSAFTTHIDCEAESTVITTWSILDKDNPSGAPFDLETLGAVITREGLFLPPLALDYGLYILRLSVQIKNLTDMATSASTYVRIIGSDLVAGFSGGEFQLKGFQRDVEVNAVDASLDPDSGDTPDTPAEDKVAAGMTFDWYCFRLEEEDVFKLLDDQGNLPTVPIPSTAPAAAGGGSDLGGCFGGGPGKLDVRDTTGKLAFNTGMMEANISYVFKAVVKKDTRERSVRHTLMLQAGDPPTVSMKCLANCFPKTNPQVAKIMSGSCDTCGAAIPTMKWSLSTGGTDVPLTSAMIDTLEGGRVLTLTLPANMLKADTVYELALTVNIPGATQGLAKQTIYVNAPPHGGACSVTPPGGFALEIFAVSCTGWQDDGEHLPPSGGTDPAAVLAYSYEYILYGQSTAFSTLTPMLPLGDASKNHQLVVVVHVADMYQTAADVEIVVQVQPAKASLDDTVSAAIDIDPSQALLNLGDTLAQFTAIANTVTPDETTTSTTDTGSTSIFRQRTAEGEAQAAEAARIAQEQKEQQNKVMAAMMTKVFTISNAASSGSSRLQLIGTVATLVQKLDPGVASAETKSQSMSFVSDMVENMDITELDFAAQADFANQLLSVQSTNSELTLDDAVSAQIAAEEAKEKEQDVPVSEDDEILKHAQLEQKKQEQNALAKQSLATFEKTMVKLSEGLRSNLVENAKVNVGSRELSMTLVLSEPENLNEETFASAGSSIHLPDVTEAISNSDLYFGLASSKLVFQVAYSASNVYALSETAADVTSGITQLSLTDEDERFIELDDFHTTVTVDQIGAEDNAAVNMTNATRDDSTGMVYIHVSLASVGDTFLMSLQPGDTEDPGLGFEVYVKMGAEDAVLDKPNATFHDYMHTFPNYSRTDPWQLAIPGDTITPPGMYLGILPVYTDPGLGGQRRKRAVGPGVDGTNGTSGNDSSIPNFGISAAFTRCRAWDDSKQTWESDTCKVTPSSTLNQTVCDCSRMSKDVRSFASGFQVPTVNPIDFNYIFANFSTLLMQNPTVLCTLLAILLVYLLLAIWARRADRRDVERWGVTPLIGNLSAHRAHYKVSVYTGLRKNAGTKSKVFFVLTGDGSDTGVRAMDDGKKKHFSRGSIRTFIMSTEHSLGSLSFMRLWHDNSGKSDHAGWYLDKVLIEDLASHKKYFFLCSRWLAVDEDDGQVDRILPVGNTDEVLSFNHLFFTKARHKLFDDHLWLSVAARPSKSSFTRLQRLTCIVTLLFSTMVVNAMFYRDEGGPTEGDVSIHIGPIILSAQTILLSVFSALIVVPINTVIVTIFRKAAPKGWMDEDDLAEERSQKKAQDKEIFAITGYGGEPYDEAKQSELIAYLERVDAAQQASRKRRKRWWKKKYWFPWWTIYVAWTVALATTAVSAAFVLFYSLEWGKEISEKWLSSLFLATLESIVVIQPVKVVMVAVAMAILFKTLENDDDDDDSAKNATPAADEEMLEHSLIHIDMMAMSLAGSGPKPPSKKSLEKSRQKREYEKRMWSMLWETTFYFLFLLLICFIAWGSKDDLIFRMNQSICDQVAGGSTPLMMKSVNDGFSYWQWLKVHTIPAIFFMKHYSGAPTTKRQRAYLGDGSNYRVGPLRLRQLRVKPDRCDAVGMMRKYVIECNEDYNLFTEEDRNYTTDWTLDPIANYTAEQLTGLEKAHKYHSFVDLRGIPYWGKLGTYGGGGYVADLGTTQGQALSMINQLIENSWLDYYTRAVFLEFTTYSPTYGIFAQVEYLFEFPAIGGVFPFPRVTSFVLYTSLGGVNTMVIIAELVYVGLIVYFLVRETLAFRRDRKAYMADPWNYLEISIIGVSIGAISMFALREGIGRMVLEDLAEDPEKYTNFMAFSAYDEVYSYLIGTIVFVANIKFLRLLRFNKHVNHFAETLRICRKELAYFGITFVIIFGAFSTFAYLAFGKTMIDFLTIVHTVESLYSMLIGRFDFREMENADRTLGPLFFLAFVILVYFITINMFLGIIGTAYHDIRMKPDLQSDEYKVMEFLIQKVKKWFGLHKPETVPGDGYVDSCDALSMRISEMDRLVSQQYRRILGMDEEGKQAMKKAGTKGDLPPTKFPFLRRLGRTQPGDQSDPSQPGTSGLDAPEVTSRTLDPARVTTTAL